MGAVQHVQSSKFHESQRSNRGRIGRGDQRHASRPDYASSPEAHVLDTALQIVPAAWNLRRVRRMENRSTNRSRSLKSLRDEAVLGRWPSGIEPRPTGYRARIVTIFKRNETVYYCLSAADRR